MPAILLVKLSSLGDVIHNFPVATDLRAHFPDKAIHWVVEEAFAPLVKLHPAIDRVIPLALRRWRGALLSGGTWREVGEFRRTLRATSYEAILDTQGLVKSAIVARLALGRRIGYGRGTAREPFAVRFYDTTYECTPGRHALHRGRQLAAQAFGYTVDDRFDYGIRAPAPTSRPINGPYCILFHSTSRASKLWAEDRWIELGRTLVARGLACALPWGNDDERVRSERLAVAIPGAVVPPRMEIPEMASFIAGARVVIGVDTGLLHLAAALSIPVAGLFCDSYPAGTAPIGPGPTCYRGGPGSPPTVAEAIEAVREVAPGLL